MSTSTPQYALMRYAQGQFHLHLTALSATSCSLGIRGSFLGLKRLGREADHSSLYKPGPRLNAWSHTSTSPRMLEYPLQVSKGDKKGTAGRS
jgi:hypothetical protein